MADNENVQEQVNENKVTILAKNKPNMTVEELIKERLKIEYVQVIPEEKWDSLAKRAMAEIDEEIIKIGKDMIREQFKNMFNNELQQLSWAEYNAETRQNEMKQTLKQILIDASPQMFSNVMSTFVMQHLQNISYNKGY